MTYAIIKTGGKQYRITPGEKLKIEKLDIAVGEKVIFDQVLAISDGQEIKVGQPLIAKTKISATVLAQERGEKIRIFKMRRRKHYKKSQGHRQSYTEVQFEAF